MTERRANDTHSTNSNKKDASDYKKKAAHFFSAAKDKMLTVVEDGSQKSSQLFDKVKAKVVAGTSGSSSSNASQWQSNHRQQQHHPSVRDGLGSSAPAPASRVTYSCGGFSGYRNPAAAGPGMASTSQQFNPPSRSVAAERLEQDVRRLVAMGFPASAARHALDQCNGKVQLAADWLADPANADEVLAAEMQAEEGSLATGTRARIEGLQSNQALNGLVVVLEVWNESAQRWAVQLPNGSHKSIRPRNLVPVNEDEDVRPPPKLESSQPARQQQPQQHRKDNTAEMEEAASQACVQAIMEQELEAQELRRRVCALISPTDPVEAEEALTALSTDDLLELLAGLQMPSTEGQQHRASSSPSPAEATLASAVTAVDPIAQDTCAAAAIPEREEAELKKRGGNTEPLGEATAAATAVAAAAAPAVAEPNSEETASSEEATKKVGEKGDAEDTSQTMPCTAERDAVGSHGGAADGDASPRTPGVTDRRQSDLAAAAVAKAEQRLKEKEQELREKEAKMLAWEEQQKQHAAELEAREVELQAKQVQCQQLQEEAERDKESSGQLLESQEAVRELEAQLLAAKQATEEREQQLLEEEAEQMRVADALRAEEARLQQQKRSVFMLQQSLLRNQAAAEPTAAGGCVNMQLDDSDCAMVEPVQNNELLDSVGEGDHVDRDAASDAQEDEEVWDLDWTSLNAMKEEAAAAAPETELKSDPEVKQAEVTSEQPPDAAPDAQPDGAAAEDHGADAAPESQPDSVTAADAKSDAVADAKLDAAPEAEPEDNKAVEETGP